MPVIITAQLAFGAVYNCAFAIVFDIRWLQLFCVVRFYQALSKRAFLISAKGHNFSNDLSLSQVCSTASSSKLARWMCESRAQASWLKTKLVIVGDDKAMLQPCSCGLFERLRLNVNPQDSEALINSSIIAAYEDLASW